MNKGYLTQKEKIAIYALQHPEVSIGSVADQRRALFDSYGPSHKGWLIKNKVARIIVLVGLFLLFACIVAFKPELLYIFFL